MRAELQACLEPIAGGAGADARHEPEHERVRREIEKLGGLSDERPDWAVVEQLGLTLLASRGKDLTIAAFVAGASVERAGWAGLLEASELLSSLIANFGDALHPSRPRARANALQWWIDHASTRVPSVPRSESVTATRAAVQALSERASELLAGDAPPFGELLRAMDRAVSEAAPPVVSQVAPAPKPEPPPLEREVPTDEAGIARYLRVEGTRLIELASARRELDLRDARAYRWLRTGLWLGWDGAPPEGRNGRTGVAPASPSQVNELKQAQAEQRWSDVVRLSETLLVMVPHWLELCFITAQALRELGSEYAAARAAVERETRALHARIPELAQRSFRDGSALAPAEVVQWLNVGQRSTEVATLPAEPRAADDSMEGLMRELQEAPSPRARFLQRCKLARAFVASGEAERAKFVYRGLLHEVDAFALERWEPALALDVVQPLRALIEPRTPGGVKDAEAEALYVRLARLAPWMELKRSDGKSA